MRLASPLLLVVALFAAVALVAGCGGDDDNPTPLTSGDVAEEINEPQTPLTVADAQSNLEAAGYTVTLLPPPEPGTSTLGNSIGARVESTRDPGFLGFVYDVPNAADRQALLAAGDRGDERVEIGELVLIAANPNGAENLSTLVESAQGG